MNHKVRYTNKFLHFNVPSVAVAFGMCIKHIGVIFLDVRRLQVTIKLNILLVISYHSVCFGQYVPGELPSS